MRIEISTRFRVQPVIKILNSKGLQASALIIQRGLENGLYSKRCAYFNSHQSAYISLNLLVYLCTITLHATRRFFNHFTEEVT